MASAKKTESSTQLRELGFDPTASPAEAVAKLSSLRDHADQTAVAQALGNIATPEAAAMLAEMEAGATGARRREIRRALFRLRQHGVEPPRASIDRPAPPPQAEETGLSALLSAVDAAGARLVWLIKARPGGGLKRLWGIVSEDEGLVAASAETISRKEYRSERAEIEQRAGGALIDADWRLADFILCEAYRRTPEARRARVGDFMTLRAEMIPTAPPAVFHHPIYEEFAAQLADEPSAELMKAPEVAAYKLPPEAVKPFAGEFTSLQQSTLVLNRMQQEERALAVVEHAMEALLKDEIAARLRRRLEDTAYYFARMGKSHQAAWAAAAAARLRDEGELKRLTFFQQFMRAQLGAILAEEQEKRQEEPRLIITPAEAMRARAAARGMHQRRRA